MPAEAESRAQEHKTAAPPAARPAVPSPARPSHVFRTALLVLGLAVLAGAAAFWINRPPSMTLAAFLEWGSGGERSGQPVRLEGEVERLGEPPGGPPVSGQSLQCFRLRDETGGADLYYRPSSLTRHPKLGEHLAVRAQLRRIPTRSGPRLITIIISIKFKLPGRKD